MTRRVETLQHSDAPILLYTCGLTVYSQPHIGNWVGYIYWDILVRTLRDDNQTVIRTQNITDVGHLVSDDDSGEDKMEKGAQKENMTAWEVAKKYSDVAEKEAYQLLSLLRPDHLVAATDYIDQQIAFAKELEEKGFTYLIEDGLYFDTSKLSDYGKLARLDIAGLEAGARVAMAGKKNVTDFAIWKLSSIPGKRDMEWQSPWGVGFPGWHLECSVIAKETLGEQITIHAGGIDHIPVHHTNEIAQTESLTAKDFAQFWIHNNHLKIDGKKISKSLGNVITLQDVIDRGFDVMAFKLMVLGKHYRTEGNFTWDIISSYQNRLNNWKQYATLRWQIHDTIENDDTKYEDGLSFLATSGALKERLQNDLDTSGALTVIDEAFSRLDSVQLNKVHQSSLNALLEDIKSLLGIDILTSTPDTSDEVKRLIIERERVRENKDWIGSDKLRAEIAAYGIAVRDTSSGTVWNYN